MQSDGGQLSVFVHGFRGASFVQSNIYDELRIEVTVFPEKQRVFSSSTAKTYSAEGYLEGQWEGSAKFNYAYTHMQRFVG